MTKENLHILRKKIVANFVRKSLLKMMKPLAIPYVGDF